MKKSLSLIALLVTTSFSYAQSGNTGVIWQEIITPKVTNISALQPTVKPTEIENVKNMLSQSRQTQSCYVGDPVNDFAGGVASACPGAKLAKGSNPNLPYVVDGAQCTATGIKKMKLEFNRVNPNEYIAVQVIDFAEPTMQYQVYSQISLKKSGQACDPKTFNATAAPDPQFVNAMNQTSKPQLQVQPGQKPNTSANMNNSNNTQPQKSNPSNINNGSKNNTPAGLR